MTTGTSARRRRAALLAVLVALGLLVAACGLPTDNAVRRAGEVKPDGSERRGSPRELPPRPQPGATPDDIVTGFLDAQVSGEDAHAVSRTYLLPRTPWADDAGVKVYEAGSRKENLIGGDPAGSGPLTYEVEFEQVGAVGPDGAGSLQTAAPGAETFRLARDAAGEWRIDAVPEGLLLSKEIRDAAYTPFDVFFLPASPAIGPPHLVVDRQLLPAGSGADLVVRRVLAPPSTGLGDSGLTAAPAGVGLVTPVALDPAGAEAVVDLTAPAAAMVPSAREALAAQLVWTLRQMTDLRRLRLRVEGQPFLSGGDDVLQLRTAYRDYDPQGDEQVATVVVDGRLRAVGAGTLPASVASATSVQDLAVDPRSGQVALLSGPADDPTLSLGSSDGLLRPVADQPGLASPTWGDGAYGVWLLRTGDKPAVLLSQKGRLRRVSFPGLPPLNAAATLRVSRDGARLLLVTDGQLLLARVVPPATDGGVPRVVAIRQLRISGNVAADWLDATTLAVLLSEARPLLLVSVDGLSQEPFNQPLQGFAAQSVAALGDLPLLVGAVSDVVAPSVAATTPPRSSSPEPGAADPPGSGPSPEATPTGSSQPETRLFAGRPGPFEFLALPDPRRPRYPG